DPAARTRETLARIPETLRRLRVPAGHGGGQRGPRSSRPPSPLRVRCRPRNSTQNRPLSGSCPFRANRGLSNPRDHSRDSRETLARLPESHPGHGQAAAPDTAHAHASRTRHQPDAPDTAASAASPAYPPAGAHPTTPDAGTASRRTPDTGRSGQLPQAAAVRPQGLSPSAVHAHHGPPTTSR